jgi:uncharacterized protein (TIGR02001 family)
VLFAVPGAGEAQIAGNAALVSDYRYRGFSLSEGKPALSASVTLDHPGGAYLEVTGVAAATHHDGLQALGYQAYAGYAHRMESGVTWDVGVSHSDLTEYFQPRYRLAYSELYAGLAGRDLSAHLYYSPNYLGERAETVYASLDGARRLDETWRLFGHLGALAPVQKKVGSEVNRTQFDLSAGLAARIRDYEFRASWTRIGPSVDYPANHRQSRDALVLSAAYDF